MSVSLCSSCVAWGEGEAKGREQVEQVGVQVGRVEGQLKEQVENQVEEVEPPI